MNASNEKMFAAHVAQAIERASAIGAKATWTTAKHLDALSEAITANPAACRETLGECYNVSQFQQVLAKKGAKSGHFQREASKSVPEKVDDLLDQLFKTQG